MAHICSLTYLGAFSGTLTLTPTSPAGFELIALLYASMEYGWYNNHVVSFFSKFTLRQTSFEPEVQFLHEHINSFGKFDSYMV